jgi:hypothetical protein
MTASDPGCLFTRRRRLTSQTLCKITESFVACMADETVSGEPVCGADSLLTGKITGNFTKIGPFGEKLSARTQQNQLVAGQFPTK